MDFIFDNANPIMKTNRAITIVFIKVLMSSLFYRQTMTRASEIRQGSFVHNWYVNIKVLFYMHY